LKKVLSFLSKADWNECPLTLAYTVHKIIRDVSGSKDPYAEIKKESNDAALSFLHEFEPIVKSSKDQVETALKLAVAGNVLDFGALESPNLRNMVEKALTQEFAVNDYPILREKALKADTMIYFFDNAGEIVFDKLFLESLIQKRGKPYEKLTLVVKGGPLINDVTIEDAIYVGLNELPNAELKTVTNGEEGTGPRPDSPEVKEWIRKHEVVIAKGQGNFEIFEEEERNIFFALTVKCWPIARALGVKPGDMVVKYLP